MDNLITLAAFPPEAGLPIAQTKARYDVLSETIQAQNEVVFSYCHSLFNQTFKTLNLLESFDPGSLDLSVPQDFENFQAEMAQIMRQSTDTLADMFSPSNTILAVTLSDNPNLELTGSVLLRRAIGCADVRKRIVRD